MASVVGEREIDLSKLSIEQLNQLKTQLGEVYKGVLDVERVTRERLLHAAKPTSLVYSHIIRARIFHRIVIHMLTFSQIYYEPHLLFLRSWRPLRGTTPHCAKPNPG